MEAFKTVCTAAIVLFFFLGAPSQVVPRSCNFLCGGDTAAILNTNKEFQLVLKKAYPPLGHDFLYNSYGSCYENLSRGRISRVLIVLVGKP